MSKLDFAQMSPQQLGELVKDSSKTAIRAPDLSGMFGPVPQLGECDRCGSETGQLALAGLTVKYSGFEFCCHACYEEWLDIYLRPEG